MTTKQYLRFCPGNLFGVVGSSTAKIIPIQKSDSQLKDNYFAVPACENVYLWNLRTKERVKVLSESKSAVTCLATDSNLKRLATGHADGGVCVFSLQTGECVVSFIGHKTAVSCLTYDVSGSNLASGGKDSEIVVWNTIDEAGLFRLKGHKGPVTQCVFLQPQNVLISSSKDTYIKFWDLDTQHCFHTAVGSQYEILDIKLLKNTYLISALNNPRLRIWNISTNDNVPQSPSAKRLKIDGEDGADLEAEAEENENSKLKVTELGDLPHSEEKTNMIVIDETERVMGIHGSTKFLQLYKILNQDEMAKRLRKKKKREAKRKLEEAEISGIKAEKEDGDDEEVELTFADEFQTFNRIQLPSNINSFTLAVDKSDISKITVLFKNNSIAQYQLDLRQKGLDIEMCRNINLPGHRSFVRSLNFSFDGLSILSASDDSVKIWKSLNDEQICVSTMDCNSPLCSVFVPGDNYCIIGNEKGKLDIFEINAKDVVESIDGHDGPVRCIALSTDQNGIATGGADKAVKFWSFELKNDEERNRGTILTLCLQRILNMPDEVLCLKYSPDGKRIAIALLDSTVQVLFEDSLKLAFSLYGHQFPVTCLDISYDSSIIVTGSNDRTIRIWSMEFGSCNKRIRIEDEKGLSSEKGIMCLKFLPRTHLFFSGSKDNMVRQWDADNFQKIITLKGHHSEVRCMSVSPVGDTVITASLDGSIRTWMKTREPLVLEEEQEIEAEEREKEIEDLPEIPGEANKEVALPGMKTSETIRGVDQLIEALETYEAEVQKRAAYKLECKQAEKMLPEPPMHPLFIAYRVSTPIEYLQKVLRKIKPSELEGILLHLPFNYVLDYLKILAQFAERGWDEEFVEKFVSFITRIHFGELSTTRGFRPVIAKLKEHLFKNVYHVRDMVCSAKVVTNLYNREIEARQEVSFFASKLDGLKKKKNKGRKKLRPIMTLS